MSATTNEHNNGEDILVGLGRLANLYPRVLAKVVSF